MTQLLPQCENLQAQVDSLLHLLNQEPSLRMQDITGVQASLKKAISPKFEIVFAGAFSAGKSMLINALLERELLYCSTALKDTPPAPNVILNMPKLTKNESFLPF